MLKICKVIWSLFEKSSKNVKMTSGNRICLRMIFSQLELQFNIFEKNFFKAIVKCLSIIEEISI